MVNDAAQLVAHLLHDGLCVGGREYDISIFLSMRD
jgi:hypothetical protein